MWDNPDDANMRLAGCVVRHAGRVVYVERIDGDMDVLYTVVGDQNEQTKMAPLDDPDWDFSPMPTGYMNIGDVAYYVERVPCRRWKHGLHPDNVMVSPPRLPVRNFMKRPEFRASIENKYPSFDEVLKAVRQRAERSRAFCKHYALRRDEVGLVWLLYRDIKVGWLEDDSSIHLGPEFEFLKEDIAEVMQ